MGDVYDAATRSRVMRQIKKKDTEPEMRVRRTLHRLGFRFRLHRSDLPGTPDIVLPQYRTVILVHGCFWHQHRCRLGKTPKSNQQYWLPKLARNIARDRMVQAKLRALGWRVLTIWECQTIHEARLERLIKKHIASDI